MKKVIFILLAFFASECAQACLNYYYTLDSDGHFHSQDGGLWHFDKNFDQEKIVNQLTRLENKLRKEKVYTVLSDYAVGLMKLGKAKEAQEILQVLYNNYSNEYRLASNLGTAYELIGENDSALKYIKRGIELNPADHKGSEWIHVKILEAKLQLKNNPSYLENRTILNLTKKQLQDPKVAEQIEVQVRERFPFSPGPEPIMASLMIDLGDTYAQTRSIEYAKVFYDISREYFGNTSPQLQDRIDKVKKLKQKYANKELTQKDYADYYGMEGEHNKLGYVNYKHLMDDKQGNYKLNWDNLNSNVDELLALVDLKKSGTAIKDAASKDDSDGLKFVKDESTTIENNANTKNNTETSVPPYIYIIAGLLLSLTLFFILKPKK